LWRPHWGRRAMAKRVGTRVEKPLCACSGCYALQYTTPRTNYRMLAAEPKRLEACGHRYP